MDAEDSVSADEFDFDVWSRQAKLKDQTVSKLKEEDLETLDDLLQLSSDDINDLQLSTGQRNALKKGVDLLKNKHLLAAKTNTEAEPKSFPENSQIPPPSQSAIGDIFDSNDLADKSEATIDLGNHEEDDHKLPTDVVKLKIALYEELRDRVVKHGLDGTYWMPIFMEDLQIKKIQNLRFLSQKDINYLKSKTKAGWQVIVLTEMLKEAGATIIEGTTQAPSSMVKENGHDEELLGSTDPVGQSNIEDDKPVVIHDVNSAEPATKDDNELTELIEKHDLDACFWMQILKKELKIKKSRQLRFLPPKDVLYLISKVEAEWQKVALKQMLMEAGAQIEEGCPSSLQTQAEDTREKQLDQDTHPYQPGENMRAGQEKNTSPMNEQSLPEKYQQFETETNVTPQKLSANEGDMLSQVTQMLKMMNLDKYYPEKINSQMVLSTLNECDEKQIKQFMPLSYLHQFIMLNFKTRDIAVPNTMALKPSTYKPQATSSIISSLASLKSEVNPEDIFLLIFHCCDLQLRQIIVHKLFLCRLAIPFIYPTFKDDRLQCSFWALRGIATECKNSDNNAVERSIVKANLSMVAFCRFRPLESMSKSIILNGLLSDGAHPTFFHRDSPRGGARRRVSNGVIETSWYLPSGKECDLFERCMMVLNLRGDCSQFTMQSTLLSKIAAIVVLFVDIEELNKREVHDTIRLFLKHTKAIVVIRSHVTRDLETIENVLGQFCAELGQSAQENVPMICTFTLDGPKNATMVNAEIRETLNKMILEIPQKTMEDCKRTLQANGCVLDEDDSHCKKGKEMAVSLKLQPSATLKNDILPLQGKLWLKWSQLQKKQHRSIEKGNNTTSTQGTKTTRREMAEARAEQVKICEQLTRVVDTFINILVSSQQEKVVPYFLLWLKFNLDEISRNTLPELHQDYQEKWKEYQQAKLKNTPNQKTKKDEMDYAENKLANASFGLEHIFREIGQMYEAVMEHKPMITNCMKDIVVELPMAVARLLLKGQPFELMDGDASNIPITWVKAVFSSLEKIVGQTKIFIISVLGIQSSGKSTLLNTMFGLQFAVSAGRCTRGVYLQLIKVDGIQGNLPYQYILVIDTEGLRAPELGQQKYDHDNEIATLVIGLGDVTVINIKGENYTEMKDVIQVAVHAFLRMKAARRNKTNRSRCVFIHQNVPASNAAEKMRRGCQKLQEGLDEMAVNSAEHENILDIKSFNDIIKFDCFKDVWFFPDLWHGDPPMAHANVGYTEKVRLLKQHILFELSKGQNSFFSIDDVTHHIADLWQGILTDDFVFSFKNVIELKAYSQLENRMLELMWATEDVANTWLKGTAENRMGSCGNDEETKSCEKELKTKLEETLSKQLEEDLKTLRTFFKVSSYSDNIMQWKEKKMISVREHNKSLFKSMTTELSDLRQRKDLDILATKADMTHRDEIILKAGEVASRLKGQGANTKKLKEEFEHMWEEWQKGLSVRRVEFIRPEKILEDIHEILKSVYDGHRPNLKKELTLYPIQAGTKLVCLANCLQQKHIDKDDIYISIDKSRGLFDTLFTTFDEKRCYSKALELINVSFVKVDTYLQGLKNTDVRFEKAYVKTIVEHVRATQHYVKESKYKMTLTHGLFVKMAVISCQFAYPIFCELEAKYEKKHGFDSMMETYKDTTWKLFLNTVAEKEEEVIAADLVCDLLRERVAATVNKLIPEKIVDFGIQHLESKLILLFNILDQLATMNEFEDYHSYILSPKEYALRWITKFIDKNFFVVKPSSDISHYADIAIAEQNRIIDELVNAMKKAFESSIVKTHESGKSLSMPKWISQFCELSKDKIPINRFHFKHVETRKISNRNDFLEALIKGLKKAGKSQELVYKKINKGTMQWEKETAYTQILNKIWGCDATCPFCSEPCQYSDPKHTDDGMNHRCVQHRPTGVSGTLWKKSNKLSIEVCNYEVKQNTKLSCKSGWCTITKTCGGGYHPLKDYKKYVPDWEIPPGDDLESSKYWLWYMQNFNAQIAQATSAKEADIPDHWKTISVEDARASLREIYKQIPKN